MTRVPILATTLALLGAAPVAGGQAAYTLQRIDGPPEAYSMVATGMNELGHVVGWSQFFDGGPGLRGWVWTPETGVTYLPQPPGLSTWSARDINEDGVICGDGGYDIGEAWRWDGVAYEFLGHMPNGNMSSAATIDSAGVVVCTSRNAASFLTPPDAFVAAPGQPGQLVGPGGWGTHGNDAGEVVGYVSNAAFLYTPGVGVQMLGPLGTKPLTWAWSINAHGTIVGEAASANGNSHVPWIWTEADGMQPIGNFGGSANAADINDAGLVIGNYSASGGQPWIWTAEGGLVWLDQLVGIVDGLSLYTGLRVNNQGQLLLRAYDQVNGGFLPVVLTPVPEPATWTDLGFGLAGTLGAPTLQGEGPFEASAQISVELTGALPDTTTWLAVSVARLDAPFKGGVLVPDPSPPLGDVLTLLTDGAGAVQLAAHLPGDLPGGFTLHAQAWQPDAGGPKGLAASNAVASPD